MRRGWLIAFIIPLAVAGCLGTDPIEQDSIEQQEPVRTAHDLSIMDPVGDAYEQPGPLLFACWALPCDQSPLDSGQPVDFPDLAGVAFVAEDEHNLILDILLGDIDEDISDLDRGDAFHRIAQITVCMETTRGEVCVRSHVASTPQGGSITSSIVDLDETCNEWQVCGFQVPTEVILDEPTLRLTLPKAYLFADAEELHIEGVSAHASVHAFEPGVPGRHSAATVFHEDNHHHEHVGPFSGAFGQVVDSMESHEVDIELRKAADPEPDGGPVLKAAPGQNWGAKDPQAHDRYDLRAVVFDEDPDALTVTFELAGWDGLPLTDFHIVTLFGTGGSEVYEVGILKEGGDAYGYVGHCITYACSGPYVPSEFGHNHQGWQQALPFGHDETSLTVEVPWEHIPSIGPGERVTYMQAVTMHTDVALYFGTYGDDTHGDVHTMSFMDFFEGARPYIFENGLGDRSHDGHERLHHR